MDIRSLIQFLQIARDGSYTKAASSLFLTQPTLSKTIQNLEAELGVPLFQYEGRKIELTRYGEELFNNAVPLINEFKQIPQRIKNIDAENSGPISIGVTPMLAGLYLVYFLPVYCEKNPQVDLKLTENSTYKVISSVLNGECDVGLCMLCPEIENNPILEYHQVLEDDIVALVHEKSPLIQNSNITIEDLRHEKINSYSAGHAVRDEVLRRCAALGFSPKVNFSSGNTNFLIELSRAGNGITILPKPFLMSHDYTHLRILPFSPIFPWRCCIIFKNNLYHPAVVRHFVDFVRKAFDERKHNDSST